MQSRLKFQWAKYCLLPAAGDETLNDNNNANNIIFTIKDTKLYLLVVTLLARDNQKLSKLLSQRFQRSVYWNECKIKSDNKNMTNEYRYCLKPNFVEVNRLFVLVYTNEDDDSKRFTAKIYYLPKSIIKKYKVIINEKTLLWSTRWFRHKTIRRN